MNSILPELQYHILFHLPTKRGAYERIEHLDLFVRIALVCKGFRYWVLCSAQGPLKLPEEKVAHYISSPHATDLRKFFGEINREKSAVAEKAFKDLESHFGLVASLCACSPLVTNYDNMSLIDVAIFKKSDYPLKFYLELFFGKLSLDELVQYFQGITDKHIGKWEKHTIIFDVFFNEIQRRTGSETLAKETMQPLLGKILQRNPLLCQWIEAKGMKFDMQNLSDSFAGYIMDSKLFDSFKIIIDSQPEIINQSTSCGRRLIHMLLKRQYYSELIGYCQYLLKKYPSEITAKDREGKSAISYLFEYDMGLLNKTYFTEKVLWEVREECFQTLLSYMKQQRLDFFRHDLTKFREFLVKLKDLFPDQIRFSNWLYSPYGKSQRLFLDDLLDISLLDMNLEEFFDHIAPNHGNMRETFALAKRILHFEKKDWANIKENFSKFPNLKNSLLLHLFTTVVAHYYTTVDERMSKLTEFFGLEWVHFQDQAGNTLLHHLFSLTPQSMNSSIKLTIAFMMDHGFDPNLKNKAGQTVRDLARENGWDEFLSILS